MYPYIAKPKTSKHTQHPGYQVSKKPPKGMNIWKSFLSRIEAATCTIRVARTQRSASQDRKNGRKAPFVVLDTLGPP